MTSTLNSYTNALDNLTFSDEAKAHMKARLVEGQQGTSLRVLPGGKARKHSRHVGRRVAAVAAGLVLALGCGGYGVAAAAGILPDPSEVLSDIFGDAPAQTEVIDRIGRPLDASATSNGVTVAAKAVIGDAKSCTVVFDITWEGGVPDAVKQSKIEGSDKLYLVWAGDKNDFSIDGAMSGAGGSYFYDADPSDNTIQYVTRLDQVQLLFGASIAGSTARADFHELSRITDDGTEAVATGDWNLKFKLNYEDASVSLPAGQTLDYDGNTVKLESVSVSPVGVSVRYTIDLQAALTGEADGRLSDESQAAQDKLFGLPVTVTFTDGSVEQSDSGGGSATTNDDGTTTVEKGFAFSAVHDIDALQSVEIAGQAI